MNQNKSSFTNTTTKTIDKRMMCSECTSPTVKVGVSTNPIDNFN